MSSSSSSITALKNWLKSWDIDPITQERIGPRVSKEKMEYLEKALEEMDKMEKRMRRRDREVEKRMRRRDREVEKRMRKKDKEVEKLDKRVESLEAWKNSVVSRDPLKIIYYQEVRFQTSDDNVSTLEYCNRKSKTITTKSSSPLLTLIKDGNIKAHSCTATDFYNMLLSSKEITNVIIDHLKKNLNNEKIFDNFDHHARITLLLGIPERLMQYSISMYAASL